MKSGNRMTWQRFFYSPIGIIIGCVVLFLLVRGGWGIHQKALLAQQRLDQAQTELADLQHQQSSLSSSINQLSTPAGIEAELREKYHAVKEGESVAVIVDQASSSGAGATSTLSTSNHELSWWGSVLQFIGF
jgi:cell division protein FtsB